jgi:S1-C subfamily serine protease
MTALASLPGQITELRGLFEFDARLPDAAPGAPVLDGAGRIVGIRSVGAGDVRLSNAPADAQFAEPIAPLLKAAGDIEANRSNPDVLQGSGAVLGLSVIDRAGAQGPTVTTVADCSPAQAAGISGGDVVIAVAGTTVTSSAAILSVVTRHHPGDRVRVDYIDPAGRPQHADVQVVSGTLN